MSYANRMVLYGVLLCAIISISACGKSSDDGAPPAPTLQSTRNAFLNSAQTGTVITSSATGTAKVGLDPATNKLVGTMTIIAAPATAITAMHVHDGAVGVDGGVVVGLTQTSPGVWTVDTAATALTAAQIAKFKAAGFYVNVHTTTNPNGEIRGQLMSFTEDIQPIFTANCEACHFSGGRAGFTGLFLRPADSYGTLVNKPAVQSTGMRVLPFDADNSVLYQRTAGIGFASIVGERMPLEAPALSQHNQDLIKTWITMGAMDDNGVAQTPQTPPTRTYTRQAFLNSAQTGTTVASSITGSGTFVLDTATKKVSGTMVVTGTPSSAITVAHLHDGFVGVDGPPIVTLTSADSVTWTVLAGTDVLTDAQMNKLIAGGFYVNVHTTAVASGEIRGQLMSYAENVQTIFNGRCVFCHVVGGPAAFTGLLLTPLDSHGLLFNQLATQPSATTAILIPPTAIGTRVIPFNSTDSVLYKRIIAAPGYEGSRQMPASATPLSTNDMNLIKIWIDMGALNN